MLKNLNSEEQLYAQLAELIEKEKNNDAFALPSVAEIKAVGFSAATAAKVFKRLCDKKIIAKMGKRYALPGRMDMVNGWMAISPMQAHPIVFMIEESAKEYAKTKRGISIEPCKIARL